MVDILSDEERESISKNWESIKECLSKPSPIEIVEKNFIIQANEINDNIGLDITNNSMANMANKSIYISRNAKFIKFKIHPENSENNQTEKNELIYQPSSIIYFIKYYKMEHPIFKKKENDKLLDNSVTEENVEEIFNNTEIKEIIDDRFDSYVSLKEFLEYKNKRKIEISDFYDSFTDNEYSNLAEIITNNSQKKFVKSNERNNLVDLFNKINIIKNKIIIIAGAQKIGLSFSILQIVKFYPILYIDLNTIYKLKNSDKRKYIFKKFFNIFLTYDDYNKFISQNILKLQGYNDILSFIEKIVSSLAEKLNTNIIIVIDNYDDYYTKGTKLSSDYISNIYNIIKEKNIKIVFIGRGLYISNLLVNFFYNKENIKQYILIKYYPTLGLNIENIIHSYYKENKKNEIELYFNKDQNINIQYIINNLLIIKNMKKIDIQNFNQEIPFQFFRFNLDQKKELKIEYQFDDLIDLNNLKLRESISKISNFIHFLDNSPASLKGFVFEELIISILMNNKTNLNNLNFSETNIIEVDSIYDLNNVKQNKNLKNGDILIIQKLNGQVFDFSILIDNYFIGGQIGLNKTNDDLKIYKKKIIQNEKNILTNIRILTGRDITKLKFIIILNKEWQNSLENQYNEYNNNIKSYNDKKTNFDKYQLEQMRRKLYNFRNEYGIKCCEEQNISYFLFSGKDFFFYKDNKKLEKFDINEIKFLKMGIGAFCDNEYNLVPIKSSESILNENEKIELLNKLKDNINSDIEDIKIENEIISKINLLPATPMNYGILSINNEIKLFTYFSNIYIHFLIKDNKVNKYEHSDKLFDFKFENDDSLKRYFVEFIYDTSDIEIEENTTIKSDKKMLRKKRNKNKKNMQNNYE